MAMKLVFLAFVFVVSSKVSSIAKAQVFNDQTAEAPIYFWDGPPMMAPVYYSDSPMLAPFYDTERPEYSSDSPIMAPVYISETPEGPSESHSPIYFSDYPEGPSESPSPSPIYLSDYPEGPSESPSPIYFSNYPVMAPIYHSDPPMVTQPITPRPHIPKYCAVGCVEYCRSKPINTSKRTCQRICSLCCQKCDCIPQPEKHISCGSWDKIMYHDVQVKCP